MQEMLLKKIAMNLWLILAAVAKRRLIVALLVVRLPLPF